MINRSPHDLAVHDAEAEFEIAFRQLQEQYDREQREAQELLEPTETLPVESAEPAIPDERLQPAAENIAEAAYHILRGNIRQAEEAFTVAMALGIPAAAIMNVAERTLNTLKTAQKRRDT